MRRRASSLLPSIVLACVAAACGSSGAANGSGRAGVAGDGGAASADDGGTAPTAGSLGVTRLAYVRADGSPRILVDGAGAPSATVLVRIDFLGADGNAVSFDDGSGEALSSFDVGAQSDARGSFFVDNASSPGFDAIVRAVRATLEDGVGASMVATLGDRPIRADGEACDAHGFDACVSSDLCAPDATGALSCTSDAAYRAASCARAPLLAPQTGASTVTGSVGWPTLWDAPAGCVQPSAVGQPYPQAVVRLHLDADAPSLTLTTVAPATDFDTVLFVFPSCGARATAPLACNDDARPDTSGSTVTLANVAAGDYVVVVASANASVGTFQLSVDAHAANAPAPAVDSMARASTR